MVNTEMTVHPNEYVHHFFLVASHCNAQRELSMPMLIGQIIDVAVEHANRLRVGYSDLQTIGALWVLSRITIEMKRMPRIEEHYSLLTWIESFERMFSHRNFAILDSDGQPIGYARTVWVGIDGSTRRPSDLSSLIDGRDLRSERQCPFAPYPKQRPLADPDEEKCYDFEFTDIDFNRHVTSTRYIELILNQWSLEFFDRNSISSFDINYRNEALFGQTALISVKRSDRAGVVKIDEADGKGNFCQGSITFSPRL